jgi:hypothetical protein
MRQIKSSAANNRKDTWQTKSSEKKYFETTACAIQSLQHFSILLGGRRSGPHQLIKNKTKSKDISYKKEN